VKVSLALGGAAKAEREQQSGSNGRKRVGEAPRGGFDSFVGSVRHLGGAAKAVREQQKQE
jgi:hypothetical protein